MVVVVAIVVSITVAVAVAAAVASVNALIHSDMGKESSIVEFQFRCASAIVAKYPRGTFWKTADDFLPHCQPCDRKTSQASFFLLV